MMEKSKHFTLQPLAEGVHAAIGSDGGAAICNAGLVDLGEQVLVFDTFLTPQAAGDLLQASLELFGRKPDLVINSHYHNDHTWGNQVFLPEGHIIASRGTYDLFLSAGQEELLWYRETSARQLEASRQKYSQAKDDEQRSQAEMKIGYYQGLVEALPTLRLCPPAAVFEKRLELHGTRRKAELTAFEKAHTGSDVVLHLPGEKILFLGDLLFVGCHPYLADGDAGGLMAALQEMESWGAEKLVPGHGPVGRLDDLRWMMEYLQECQQTAINLITTGSGWQDKLEQMKPGGRFATWRFDNFYEANIRFLCQGLEAEKGL